MKGARPLTNDEILLVADQFSGTFAVRNRSLFMLGVSVGGRISELLALRIGDVWQNGKPVGDLLFVKGVVKGKETARMVPVNADGRKAIRDLIGWHHLRGGTVNPKRPLFPSRQTGALSRVQAHKILEAAFQKAGLNGKLATHSMRKAYAQRMYDATGDIYAVKEVLGHQSVETTKKYLGVSYRKLQEASEQIAVEGNKTTLLFHSPQNIHTDTLVIELQRRGFDASSLIAQMQHEHGTRKEAATASGDEKVIPIQSRRKSNAGR